MKSGIYVVRADEPEYGDLEALVLKKKASFRGERYDRDGVRVIAVDVPGRGARRNPAGSMRIGSEFFTTALRDYEDWEQKWWREAIQNAVDAGATKVQCTVNDLGDKLDDPYEVICADNGAGMDRSTIMDKFLVLGGTTKVGTCTTGGFGKAKELLVLPWIEWQIHSQTTMVRGVGVDYEISEAPRRKGTELRVVMPADKHTPSYAATFFIQKCYLPKVRFRVDKNTRKAALKTGKLVRRFGDEAALYYSEKNEGYGTMLVRSNGLYMFDSWVSSEVEGTIIVELLRPSVKLLTANRDGFRDRDLRRQVGDYTNELAADVMSALRVKKGLIRKRWKGSGKFRAELERTREVLLEDMDTLEARGASRRKNKMSREQIDLVAEAMSGAADIGGGALAPNPELAKVMLADTTMRGALDVQAAIKQLAWEPDFYLMNEIEGWKVPKKFTPEGMTLGLRRLMRFWAEMCRFVLIQLGSDSSYGVGFVFDEHYGATYLREDKDNWLLLNPFVNPLERGELFTLTNRDHMMWLYAAAVHECTHMADGVAYHNEAFASAMTRNVAKTAGKDKQIREIKRLVYKLEKSQPSKKTPQLTVAACVRGTKAALSAYRVLNYLGIRGEMAVSIDDVMEGANVSAELIAHMVAQGLVEGDESDEYWRTDKGFNWYVDCVDRRELRTR